MKRVALLYLTSGMTIVVLAFAVALSAMQTSVAQPEHISSTDETCLFCHVDSHTTWNLITAEAPLINTTGTIFATSADDSAQRCTNCHLTDDDIALAADAVETAIGTMQARVTVLQDNLTTLYSQHSEWEANTRLSDKPNAQVTAERIDALLAIIIADGSWGFHDEIYTEEILTEAEMLMASLLTLE